ncbi:UNKNOWN [Stylonychia lemnae]|uniref:Glycine amidinotransferase, mitochondrial n=1 Tax=Stylonychia lemnae TaxID=5949 RepID=A0A078A7K1_STYLE|nr:UNKNOWN [Stylonychia lemnae]|eukprot:CDW77532.1 UNKNOWN [Stylonychia lemnae]
MDQQRYSLEQYFEELSDKQNTLLPRPDAYGTLKLQEKINIFTEFEPVKAIVLGCMSDTSRLPSNEPLLVANKDQDLKACQQYPAKICARAREIANEVARKLVERGIEVRALGSKWYKSWVEGYSIDKPLWDAANLIRVGLDIIFLISLGGTESGYQNFKNFMLQRYNGLVRVHPTRVYQGFHIDTTFTTIGYSKILKKYILLANSDRTNPTNIPAIFRGKNWVVLNSPAMIDMGYEPGFQIATPSLGQNILVLNPNLVLIDEYQKPLIEVLQFYGIESLTVKHEIGRSVAGGFHCMANDYSREETIDFEKILGTPIDQLSAEEKAGYFDPVLLNFLQSNGDIEHWEEIANQNAIFPEYLTEHLSFEEKEVLARDHREQIESAKIGVKQFN